MIRRILHWCDSCLGGGPPTGRFAPKPQEPTHVYVSPALAAKMKEHPGSKVCVPCGGKGSHPGTTRDWSGPGRPPSKCWSCEGAGFVVPAPLQERLIPGSIVRIDRNGRPIHMEAALASTFQILMDALSDSDEHVKLRAWAKDTATRWGLLVTFRRSGSKGRIKELASISRVSPEPETEESTP